MEEAEYLESKVTILQSSYNIVNFYCPNDKKLSLDIIQILDSNFLVSREHNWLNKLCFRQYKHRRPDYILSQVAEDVFQSKKVVTLAVFVDLQRAFDKVWKDALLAKRLRYGIVEECTNGPNRTSTIEEPECW
ncbi:Hypothetical predicted protein [Mytilus galloprovincialis]|uniref:Reverse transcriptase domain-containing protein n=1 Tax=Mytilus galloprovincialis TaxID=29158 RepID=A0A8B6G6M2_MYTGA|nr:Hypothetical predicted protein [Mytilus galloprovincialis]